MRQRKTTIALQNLKIQVRNSNKQLQTCKKPQSRADHSVGNSSKNNHCATKPISLGKKILTNNSIMYLQNTSLPLPFGKRSWSKNFCELQN
jgi:hypothetical protein